MGFWKGISPLIAAVLLIAFTMAIAGVFSQWAPSVMQEAQQGTDDSQAKVLESTNARMKIERAEFNSSSRNYTVTVRNTGSTDITNYVLTVQGDQPVQKRITGTLKPNDIKTVEVSTSDSSKSDIEVTAENVPSSTTASEDQIKVSTDSGNSDEDENGGDSDSNSAPTVSFTDNITEDPEVGDVIEFDGTGSFDPDGSIDSYEWDWENDGTYDDTESGSTAIHSYNSEGDYTVKLKVTDNDGATNTTTNTVSVGSAPSINSFSPADGATSVSTTTFNFTFNEEVEKGSGNFVLYNSSGDQIEVIDVNNNDPGSASIVTGSTTDDTVEVNPDTDLNTSTEYYWQADPGVVQDTAGNTWSGITDSTTYNFTTYSGASLTVVDDFEDNDLSEYTSNSYFTTSNEQVYNGSYALKATPPSNTGEEQIVSSSGLNTYPSQGDTWEYYQRMTTTDASNNGMAFGTQDSSNYYFIDTSLSGKDFHIAKYDGGSRSGLDSTSVSISKDKWYRIEVQWQTDGTVIAKIFNESDAKLGEVSATDTTYTSGGAGWHSSQYWGGSGTTVYFDYAGIK